MSFSLPLPSQIRSEVYEYLRDNPLIELYDPEQRDMQIACTEDSPKAWPERSYGLEGTWLSRWELIAFPKAKALGITELNRMLEEIKQGIPYAPASVTRTDFRHIGDILRFGSLEIRELVNPEGMPTGGNTEERWLTGRVQLAYEQDKPVQSTTIRLLPGLQWCESALQTGMWTSARFLGIVATDSFELQKAS